MHGQKHIQRIQHRIDSLNARFKASPDQADFQDEIGELKALQWVLNEWKDCQTRLDRLQRKEGINSGQTRSRFTV